MAITGSTEELVNRCLEILIQTLQDRSFKVNKEKTFRACSEIMFCGFTHRLCYATADATRNELNSDLAKKQWQLYFQLKNHVFVFIRPLPKMLKNLRVFYDATKAFTIETPGLIDESIIKQALFELVDFVQGGLPPFILGKFKKVHASIVVDANRACQLYYLITLPNDYPQSVLPRSRQSFCKRRTLQFLAFLTPTTFGTDSWFCRCF